MLWQGGGHRNAAGCTMTGERDEVAAHLVSAMAQVIDTPAAAATDG
jgi:nanoRNase/pAp phosphatase (c-di-AMP/oligoRNAs hydrolase)